MAATESLMEGGQASYEKNGEKVNFELQPKNIGLTKEQLEAYRNDPFWKPVRTVLFAVFWLSWIAMFVAAIAIVVLSPKCAEKEQPIWWQTKMSYQLSVPLFRDSDGNGVGDFNGVTEKLELLRKIGVNTIHPKPVVELEDNVFFDSYAVIDHSKVDKRFGSEEDFKKLVQAVHDRDMYIVMDLPISSVSNKNAWFVNGDTDKFIIARPNELNSPNYFDWPGKNGTKYMGAPDASHPALNWDSEPLREAIVNITKKYLLLGVDGFHFDKIGELSGTTKDNDARFKKSMAVYRMLARIIRDVAGENEDIKQKNIVVFSSLTGFEDRIGNVAEFDNPNIIDTSFTKISNITCKADIATCVHTKLQKSLGDVTKYYWQFENAETSRLASRFDSETANLLTMLELTLPGAIALNYGQEIGMKDAKTVHQNGIMKWNSDANSGFSETGKLSEGFEIEETSDDYDKQYSIESSTLKIVQKLAKLRQRDEVMRQGAINTVKIDNVVGIGRFMSNNGTVSGSVYLGVFNFGNETADLKFNSFEQILPEKDFSSGEIVAVTAGVQDLRSRQKVEYTGAFTLPSKQGALIKF